MRRQSDLDDIYGVKQIKSNPLDKDNDAAETGFRHSDAYHRYFRGYTEIRIPGEVGRFSIARYYTQPWIVDAASEKDYLCKRVFVGMLLVLSWIAYIYGMCMDVGSNRWSVAAIPGLTAVILLVVFSTVATFHLFAPRKMTLWQHESTSNRLKKMALATGSCMSLTAVTKLVYMLVMQCRTAAELASFGITAVAAISAICIYVLERRTVYTTVPNDTVLPEGEAHEIW